MTVNTLKYVLVTPARNEEAYISSTIESVVSQTLLPEKWAIVSDGSTDRTDEIIQEYVRHYNWIEYLRMPEHRDRQFAAKVQCFNRGHERISSVSHDIVGNLDADLTFRSDYFQYMVDQFRNDLKLGVAGTPFIESENEGYDYRFTNIEHVSGACQLFRKECFGEIGGYKPIRGGGIDWVAVTTARMKGWKTRTFTERVCYHHRKIGTASNGRLLAHSKQGQKDYFLGGHPLWQLLRACYQMTKKPYVAGGFYLLSGYFWAFVTRVERPIPEELIDFHRKEQMRRLKRLMGRRQNF